MRILAADIGGTNAVLALYEGEAKELKLVHKERYRSTDFENFESLFKTFLGDRTRPQTMTIAVAGPVAGGRCRTTNLPWEIDAMALEETYGIHTTLINDFEAIGYGVAELGPEQLAVIQEAPLLPRSTAAVLGAGTGLGQAFVIPRQSGLPLVVASEGGHSDFAPRNDDEIELFNYLRKIHRHVSYERVLSGPGLVHIHNFLLETGRASTSDEIKARIEAEDSAAVIGEVGLADSTTSCAQALRLFAEIYGAQAGNLALQTLPRGGVYLAGGIAPKILPILKKKPFLLAFRQKGRMSTLLGIMRVSVILDTEVGLHGARRVAADLHQRKRNH